MPVGNNYRPPASPPPAAVAPLPPPVIKKSKKPRVPQPPKLKDYTDQPRVRAVSDRKLAKTLFVDGGMKSLADYDEEQAAAELSNEMNASDEIMVRKQQGGGGDAMEIDDDDFVASDEEEDEGEEADSDEESGSDEDSGSSLMSSSPVPAPSPPPLAPKPKKKPAAAAAGEYETGRPKMKQSAAAVQPPQVATVRPLAHLVNVFRARTLDMENPPEAPNVSEAVEIQMCVDAEMNARDEFRMQSGKQPVSLLQKLRAGASIPTNVNGAELRMWEEARGRLARMDAIAGIPLRDDDEHSESDAEHDDEGY